MGWTFTYGQSKKGLISDRNRRQESDGGVWECVAHAVRGDVLWQVIEFTAKQGDEAGKPHRFIVCNLLSVRKNEAGYKDMEESMHPFFYSCPIKFLDMVPEVAHEEWRKIVREHHATRSQTFKVGDIIVLRGSTVPEVVCTSVRPLRGEYCFHSYRIPRRFIAPPADQKARKEAVAEMVAGL